MKVIIGNYIYESEGEVFSDDDVKELLESHRVDSLAALNSLLEAIDQKNADEDEEAVPDLEPTPEEVKETEKMTNSQNAQEPPQEPTEAPTEEPSPESSTPEEVPPVEPETPQTEEPVVPEEPQKEEKPKVEKPVAPRTNPPAIPPKADLDQNQKAPSEWLPSKKLSTLYNNYIDFFGADSIDDAGTIVGLNAPGLSQESKYVQCDITADVQGKEAKPYRTWIKLRRRRNTQNWSFNNPCEVRCSCKAFAYYVANANVRNKSLAGVPAKGKTYRDENGIKRTINFLLPSPKNNPASVPALCKHLALVAKRLLDNNMITEE